MDAYLIVKTLHILSSVLLVGTGFGGAYYLYFVQRRRSVAALAVVAPLVVRADWWFTTPTAILQPLTGLWLALHGGWPLNAAWILGGLALYALARACWVPVVVLQVRMAEVARTSLAAGQELPDAYWRMARTWERLGYPAFAAMIGAYFLMVLKPAF